MDQIVCDNIFYLSFLVYKLLCVVFDNMSLISLHRHFITVLGLKFED